MKCIRVTINKLEVERFSIRDGAELKIYFDDGSKKCIQYSARLENVKEDVKDIFLKINVYEKSQNQVLDADNAMDGFISILIEDEDYVVEKSQVFLSRLGEQKRQMKGYGTHEGYIENMNKLQKQVIEFRKREV